MPMSTRDFLSAVDPAVAAAIAAEEGRQQHHLELIAYENFTSRAVTSLVVPWCA